MIEDITAEEAEDTVVEDVDTEAQATDAVAEPTDSNWRDTIDDKATRKLADRYTSPAEVAKALREANVELSNRVKMPGEDAGDDEMTKFRTAMGVPNAPGGYEIGRPEHMSEEVFNSDEVQTPVANFAETMHKAGAPKTVVDAAMDWYWTTVVAEKAALDKRDQAAVDSASAQLRKEWGPDYDANLTVSNKFVTEYSGDELLHLELKDGTLLGSDPSFLRFMATAGRKIDEGLAQLGLHGTEAGVDLEKQYADLTTALHAATDRGDMDKAKRIDAERATISEQLFGDRPVPGRAA